MGVHDGTGNTSSSVKKQSMYSNDEIPKFSGGLPPSIWVSKRFFVAIVIFVCFTNCVMVMVSPNIAIVEMTSSKLITVGNETIESSPEFPWDSATIGIISSVYLYGELLSFFASFFIKKIGGSTSCALCMIISGILTVLQPATLHLNYNLFLVNRFLTGCFVSSFFVSCSQVYSFWFPKKERSTLITLCYNGSNVGVTISYPVFGYVATQWGWEMVFYVSGSISIILALACIILVKNSPAEDEQVSYQELQYILSETDYSSEKEVTSHRSHHYKNILLSAPVLALGLTKFTFLWVDTIIAGCLPLYVRDLTGDSTDQIGLISSVPSAVEILIFPVAGTLLDYWKNNTNIKLTTMHKILISWAYLSACVFFIAITLSTSFTISMVFFVLIQITLSVVPPVVEPIIVNIAPNDSSIVAGLCKLFGSFGTIISRTLTGFMTNENSLQEWNNCFLLVSFVLSFTTVIFVKFGSSQTQSWSSLSSLNNDDEESQHLIKK